MKALIFAAGIGSRLKPFTDNHPKALVEVGGMPMLQRTIEKLRNIGADRIVVNVHHFASQIVGFIEANDSFGSEIVISDESARLLDTGGGLLKAQRLIGASNGEPIILHNADILCDAPLCTMVERHHASGAIATLLTGSRTSSRQLYFDPAGSLCGWHNKKNGELTPADLTPEHIRGLTPMAFNGIHVVDNRIFPYLHRYADKHGEKFSIIPFYIDAIGAIPIKSFTPQMEYMWHDIGTPEKLAAAEKSLHRNA